MPFVLSCCSHKGRLCWELELRLLVMFELCFQTHMQNFPGEKLFFFFASFSVKRKQVCVRIQSVLSSFPKAFRCFDAFLEHIVKVRISKIIQCMLEAG